MALPYSGGTIYDQLVTVSSTRLSIVAALETALTAAGWAVISGTGSGDVVMESATTPAPKSNKIRVRLQDPGSGNCATVKIQNVAADRVSQGIFLLPGTGKQYRIIACKYNCFIFTPGSTAEREYAGFGTLHIPTFLEGIVIGELGWIQGNTRSDGGGSPATSFRTDAPSTRMDAYQYGSTLTNGTLLNLNDYNVQGGLEIITRAGNMQRNTTGRRWHDDTIRGYPAELAYGLSISDEAKSRGYIHNMMILSGPYPADDRTLSSFDSHAWHALTANNSTGVGGQYPPSTCMIAIT